MKFKNIFNSIIKYERSFSSSSFPERNYEGRGKLFPYRYKAKPVIKSSKEFMGMLRSHAIAKSAPPKSLLEESMKKLDVYDHVPLCPVALYVRRDKINNPAKQIDLKFDNLSIHPTIIKNLAALGFLNPTRIQIRSIPEIRLGKNLYVCGQNGSGKTMAFLIPVMQSILSSISDSKSQQAEESPNNIPSSPIALVVSPSSFLCHQIINESQNLCANTEISCSKIDNWHARINCHIGVSTIESILAESRQESLDLSRLKYIIMDEADAILYQGTKTNHLKAFMNIIHKMHFQKKPQFIFTSATLPGLKCWSNLIKHIPDLEPVFVRKHLILPHLEYKFKRILSHLKYEKLVEDLKIFAEVGRKVLVFFNNIDAAVFMYHNLTSKHNIACNLLKSSHSSEDYVQFRKFEDTPNVGLCTDSIARGMHFSKVDTVINFDFPNIPLMFLHRAGRIGRMGNSSKKTPFVLTYISHRKHMTVVEEIRKATFDNLEILKQPRY